MSDINKAFRNIQSYAETSTNKSFYGGGCMKYKDVLGFLDGTKKTDTVNFHLIVVGLKAKNIKAKNTK